MSQVGKRLAYNNAKNAMKRAGVSASRAVLSQSYLRFEAPISASQTQYTFDTLVNENLNPNYSTQQKLNLQDAFYISDLGFFIGLPASSSTTEANVRLFSYAASAATTLLGATPSAAQANILPFYNGFLSLTINQRIMLPSWDLYRHYVVNQTQQITANTAVGAQDQINLGHEGFYAVEPNLVLIGSKKNVLQIVIPSVPAAVIANTRLVIIARGILAQNASSIQ
jgi:hypothetical protein